MNKINEWGQRYFEVASKFFHPMNFTRQFFSKILICGDNMQNPKISRKNVGDTGCLTLKCLKVNGSEG